MQREYAGIRDRGGEVVAIGQGPTKSAERICGSVGVTFPCLGDPDKASYRSFGLPRGGLREILVEPMRAGNQAVRAGHRVSVRGSLMSDSDWFQLPGLAIVDRDGTLRYLHCSRHAGDLPPTATVLAALDAVLR